MGGGYDYAGQYEKYLPEQDTQFESYVDKYPDLTSAWARIQESPDHPDSQYWIKRGATSKSAFGRAHAAEDMALKTGDYHGGKSGRTDYMPGTDAWKTLFPGEDPQTRFSDFLTTKGRSRTETDTTDSNTAPPFYHTGGGSYGDRNYPIGLMDYAELDPMAASYGLEDTYSPWAQPDYIPDSLWNYTPPELVDWDMSGRVPWDWATKDISEYTPEDEVTKARVAQQMREGRQVEGYQDPYPGLVDPTWGADASNPYASPDYDAAANAAIAAQIQAMNDIAEDDYMGNVAQDFGIGTGAGLNYDG